MRRTVRCTKCIKYYTKFPNQFLFFSPGYVEYKDLVPSAISIHWISPGRKAVVHNILHKQVSSSKAIILIKNSNKIIIIS